MRLKLVPAALVAALAVSLLGTSTASAATQAGNTCVGNEGSGAETVTYYGVANGPGNPLPATIPISGVVTSWTFNIIPIPPGILSQGLKILRPNGPGQFQVIGESALQLVSGGLNTFSTRIPVAAGDFIGVVGSAEGEGLSVACKTGNPGDRIGVIFGNPPLNSAAASSGEESGFQVPATVFVEPDADNDGFGDETQDLCPQSSTVQTACPVVTLDASRVVGKRAVTVSVATNTAAPVTVTGVVKLGKGKKATLKAGPKTVAPGKLARFTLRFTSKLKERLKELEPSKKLTMKITVGATNVAGQVSKGKLKAKLKGQG